MTPARLRAVIAGVVAVLGATGVPSPDDASNEELVDALVTVVGTVWLALEPALK